VSSTCYPAFSCPELTSEQIAKASRHLMQTRDALLESVAGLSDSQWAFKPAPDRWSVAETLEHIILVETAILHNVRATIEAPLAPPEWETSQMDDFILTQVPKRTRYADRKGPPKFTAAPPLCPTGRWSTTEAVAIFLDRREQNLQMLTPGLLRGRVIPHPALGPWDGYQWLLAAGSHCSRHTSQIREVKEEPDFPSASGVSSAVAVH
jgi:DinB superfamily